MGKTAEGLVEFCKNKIGTAYVYGTKGEVLTEDKYNRLKEQYGGMVWDSDKSKIGKVCCDCSGLISWYTGIIRSSTEYRNMAKNIYGIDYIAKAPVGAAVWKQGHIGVYIGNGEYIAADGSTYGVRKRKLSEADFKYWFRIADIDYLNASEGRYKTIEQTPEWAKPTIQKLIDDGKIADKDNLDLSYDMVRVLVILER